MEKSSEAAADLEAGQVSLGERMEQLEATQRDRMEETAEGVAGIDKKALLLAVVGPQLLTVWCGR